MDKLLTLQEVAELLRSSTKTVQRIVKRGELKAVKISSGRSRLVFRPADLEAYLASRIVIVK